ncbi:unnamed protein product [Onchocerca ochengi]|uniref:Cytoplasmic polyadenylation element-binding protein 1 n=1 Tax=Onchocerca ochengi TaxID=42157 RepID=A0A182DZM9_ONCOC|nr:unnamed protein product [Onchocerca ochengi]
MEDIIAGRVFETNVDDSSRWEQNISINLRYACDLHASAPIKYPVVVEKSACQYFLDLLRKFANRNYQICEGCILEIGDAKHLNPIVQSMRFNRVNPVQAVPCHDPKAEKMQYVTKWLNLLKFKQCRTRRFSDELLKYIDFLVVSAVGAVLKGGSLTVLLVDDVKANSIALIRMMALEGDVRRRMTMMNNRMNRPSITSIPSYPSFQRSTHSVSPLMPSPCISAETRSPKSLLDGSIINSSSSSASSLQHHFYGSALKLGDKSENNSGNDCTVLMPREQLYQAYSSLSPTSLISSSAKTETSDRRNLSRNPGVPSTPEAYFIMDESLEIFARKVFVGGLPIDVTEDEITSTFSQFGPVLVDWPRRSDNGVKERSTGMFIYCSIFRGNFLARYMTGYVFLVFEDERSVQLLVSRCHKEDEKYYLFVSSPTMRDKPVQVRPWRLDDMEFMFREDMPLNPRRTIFIGGVPRPTKARELAGVLDHLYGSVCYVGIDIDPELKYPKGAARVTFTTEQSFVAAISGRFVYIPHADMSKRVEIKPYVMDEQMCDECEGVLCAGRYAPYFCGDMTCLQYYCELCWDCYHYGEYSDEKKASHKPLVRIGDQTKLLAHPPHHNHLPNNKVLPTAAAPVDYCRHIDTTSCFTVRCSQHY